MNLFSKYRIGDIELSNRMVMAPMTRSRAVEGNVPTPMAIKYYTQRASAGLMITEGSQVSPQGAGYIRTPGIYSWEQIAGWKNVTDAVHSAGGKIFLQLWHVGRVSHPDFHGGDLPVAPSSLPVDGEIFTMEGKKEIVPPRALELNEIPGIIDQFVLGAKNAKEAGFDGVEVHGANGYLLEQFVCDGSNQRSDEYGGSLENRIRLPLAVARAVIDVWGPKRVGYRISPNGSSYSISDSDPITTFSTLAEELDDLGLGYLHVKEPIAGPMAILEGVVRVAPILRQKFSGAFMVNGGYTAELGNEAIEKGDADLVSFGVPFLANPDLPERFKRGAPLNSPDFATFYAGEESGYIDYPNLDS